jgi:protocatechuate 3,4-dioxygenase beta subunit
VGHAIEESKNAEDPCAVASRGVCGSFSTCGECIERRGARGYRRISRCLFPDAAVDRGALLSRSPARPRADRRGPDGRPSTGRFACIDGATCKPSERARVDIWHADAQGIYSGYEGQGDKQDLSTVGQKFLRGTQFTDSKGAVSFETIYPGWYAGRTTHIHFKVLLDDRNVLTGQMYFPDAVNEFIYANIPAYADRLNPRAIVNANDRFANFHDPNRLSFCAIKEERDCYAVSLVLGVDSLAVAQADRPPREGGAPEQPAVERVRLLIPGFSVK